MTTANLFPDEPSQKRNKRLQKAVLHYLRSGHSITEETYNRDFGGYSISAVLHNLKSRGHFQEGEFIIREKAPDSTGKLIPSYRLAKEAPISEATEDEVIEAEFIEEEIGASDLPEGFKEDAEDVVLDASPPEVSSIYVGVNRYDPELVVNFKGDYKPLRHILTPMEVKYLLTNLEAFRPKRKAED